jgi:hypothetical protein
MRKVLKYNEDDTDEMLARLKIQKLEDLKLQVLAQNPQLLGVGIPAGGDQQATEIGSEAGGPSPMLSPEGTPPEGAPPDGPPGEMPPPTEAGPSEKPAAQPVEIEDPSEDEIKKYDLEIQGYDLEADIEDVDYSVQP